MAVVWRHVWGVTFLVSSDGQAAAASLAAYAIGYGWRSPKRDLDGSMVEAAVREGQIIDVVTYCAGDVLATAYVHQRMRESVVAIWW